MNIITEYDPSIVITGWQWSAWDDDSYDLDSPVGHGATKEEAIRDLMQTQTETMPTREEFLALPESEMNIFISKLIHAVKQHDSAFHYAAWIVQTAENNGMFTHVKFGRDALVKETIKL